MDPGGAEHRLVAILSADVVGYSRLMAEDRDSTVRIVTAYREEVGRLVNGHRGRLVDFSGDNFLAEFPSALDATRCALAVQRVLRERNAGLPPDRRMEFRMGVHLGDVRVEDQRIYGDGVNIAARLESLADPGGVCVSSSVRDQVRAQLDVGFEDLGARSLKNIPERVRVYRLEGEAPIAASRRWLWRPAAAAIAVLALVGALIWLWARAPEQTVASGPSIAVLPFDNMSGDPDQEYFSDGITEDIITGLSRFRQLLVISRNSSFQYKGRAVDVREVGRDLGVRFVLEGSVRRDADAIRVSAQLLDAKSGVHLWAETYDRDLTARNIFAVQDDITKEVIATLADTYGVISRLEQAEVREKGTDSLTAYECVLRTHEYEALHTAASHSVARDCLERAVVLEPGYVDAWAQLAYVYREEYFHGFNPRPNSLDRALETARHAVELDPANQLARFALAFTHYGLGDLEAFFVEAERAIALNPNNGRVVAGLAVHMAFAGEWERGMELTRRAMAQNPHHPGWFNFVLSTHHYWLGEYEEAASSARKIGMPEAVLTHAILAAAYGQLEREEEARAALAELLRLDPDFPEHVLGELRKIYASEDLVQEILKGLRKAGLEG